MFRQTVPIQTMGISDRSKCAEMRRSHAPNAVPGGGLHGRMERLRPSIKIRYPFRLTVEPSRPPSVLCVETTNLREFPNGLFLRAIAPHSLPERSYARAVIEALPGPRKPEAFLFPRHAEKHGSGSFDGFWRAVCADAGLGRLCLHDLRHTADTAASQTVMADENLPLVGKILGRRWPRTTAGYAHLADAHLVEAAERVGSIIAAAMESAPPANQPRACSIEHEAPHLPLRQPAETRCRVTC